MLGGLIPYLEKSRCVHLSRPTLSALKKFKALGDLSAHNRRFNAVRDDIDRVRHELRVASEEFLHILAYA